MSRTIGLRTDILKRFAGIKADNVILENVLMTLRWLLFASQDLLATNALLDDLN